MVLIKVLTSSCQKELKVKNYLFYITPERIYDCNHLGKKITLDDRMDIQTAPLRKATTLKKKMNERSQLLSINEITHTTLKNGRLVVVF